VPFMQFSNCATSAWLSKTGNRCYRLVPGDSGEGHYFINTEADGSEPNSLLSLKECGWEALKLNPTARATVQERRTRLYAYTLRRLGTCHPCGAFGRNTSRNAASHVDE